jgi:hypothetical protein
MMRESGEAYTIAPAERRKSRRERGEVGMALLFSRVAVGYAWKLYRMLWMGLSNLSKAGVEFKIALKV